MHLCDISTAGKIDRRQALKKLKSLVYKAKSDRESYCTGMDDAFITALLPNNVECTESVFGGVCCDMLRPQAVCSGRHIFYIHGGCFVGGSRKAYRSFCASLADESAAVLCIPEYRHAPVYPFPCALDDMQACFRDYCSFLYSDGEPDIFIAADTAGATIACALLQDLPQRFRQYVRALVLFSPWCDLSGEPPSAAAKRARDELFCTEDIKRCAELYTYEHNLQNPAVSPVYMSDDTAKAFPPVYMQAGEKELLLGDMQRLEALFARAGVDCVFEVWPQMMTMFQMADEFIPQAKPAVERAGGYIKCFGAAADDE